jgi:hypothetical protein
MSLLKGSFRRFLTSASRPQIFFIFALKLAQIFAFKEKKCKLRFSAESPNLAWPAFASS